jgi:hypothetical protein
MIETKQWKKQNRDSTYPAKIRNKVREVNHSSCGSCNVCHKFTRIHPAAYGQIFGRTGNGGGPNLEKPCAVNFFQRNLGNSYMQSNFGEGQTPWKAIMKNSAPKIQRKCSCEGTCGKEDEDQRIQAKLRISPVNDIYEQEADRVAEQVMRMPAPVGLGNHLCLGKQIQRISNGGSSGFNADVNLNQNGGHLLSTTTRNYMEPRFGVDFGNVRLHTDEQAQQTASKIQASAFTYRNHIWLGNGANEHDKSLMAHELTHIVQQGPELTGFRFGVPTLQRRVDDAHVSCRTTGLHGGVPGGIISGPDAIATIRTAEERAIEMAVRVENLLFLQRLTFGTGAYTAVPNFDAALMNRFGLSLANPGDHRWIEILEREFATVVNFLESGYIRYTCRGADCSADEDAYIFTPGRRIYFCNLFWNEPSLNLRGSTLLHEAIHLWWDQIEDRGHLPIHNAHCFEQFALDLAGATAEIPADLAGACVVLGP